MAVLVVFCTVYALVMPAVALNGETYCGKTEHTHDKACYESVLTCGMEEGKDGHVHDDSCYEEQLVCEKEEHTHTDACYVNPDAEEETEAKTEATTESEKADDSSETTTEVKEDSQDAKAEASSENTEEASETTTGEASQTTAQSAEEDTEEADETDASENEKDTENKQSTAEAAALPAGAQIPDGYTEQYTVRNDAGGYAVTVYAPEGVVPEGAELKAELLDENDAAYNEAKEALDAQNDAKTEATETDEQTESAEPETAAPDFAALDIHFEDADGKETEPDGNVYVVIDADRLLPADADPASVTVQHHEEKQGGEVTVETVADTADATSGVVATQMTGENSSGNVQAAFGVSSFSTFTISWDSNGATLEVYYGQLNDRGQVEELTVTGTDDSALFSSEDTIESFDAPQVDGYHYTGTAYIVTDGYWGTTTRIYDLRYTNESWRYNTEEDGSSGDWNRVGDSSVYFIYEEMPDISIEDTIFENGSITAVLADSDIEVASYTWYRSTNAETDGGYVVVPDENEATLFVADNGARHYYYVVATLDDGSSLTSKPFQVEYYNELQNGSFENPSISSVNQRYVAQYRGSQFMQIPNDYSDELVWKTSAQGSFYGGNNPSDYYIEIANGNNSVGAYGINGAADGTQFAELNCQARGALYQDVLTVPGSTIYWYLEHASRNNATDTMYVVISDTKTIEEGWNPADASQLSQDDIAETITSTSSQWSYYTGTYVVPQGQYVTRFYFVSGSGAGTDGNLLDHIGFSTELPDPPAERGNLVLQKNISEISSTVDLSEVEFTFTVNGEGEDRTVTLNEDNNWTQVLTLDVGEYEVKETKWPEKIDDYEYTSTEVAVGNSTPSNGKNATVEITSGNSSTVSFTNHYQATTADLTIIKNIYGLNREEVVKLIDGSYREDSVGLRFDVDYFNTQNGAETDDYENKDVFIGDWTFTVSDTLTEDSSGFEASGSWREDIYLNPGDVENEGEADHYGNSSLTELEDNGETYYQYKITISDVDLNDWYHVWETHLDVTNYNVATSVETTADSPLDTEHPGRSTAFQLTKDTTVTFTNRYTPATKDIVFKKVDGANPSSTALPDAKFILYYTEETTEGSEPISTTHYWSGSDWVTKRSQAYAFTSGANGLIEGIENLQIGRTYYLMETEAPDGYNLLEDVITISWSQTGTINVTMNDTPLKTETLGSGDTAVTCYRIPNTTGQELPETGGAGTTLITISGLLLMAAAVGGGYGLRRKREERY